jgi:hypothetical protein
MRSIDRECATVSSAFIAYKTHLHSAFSRRFPRAALAPGSVVFGVLVGWWGTCAISGAALMLLQNLSSVTDCALATFFFIFGILCFSTAYGLITFRNWARAVVMILSVAVLLGNVSLKILLDDAYPGLFILLPCMFSALVFWYFLKTDVVALYSRKQSPFTLA